MVRALLHMLGILKRDRRGSVTLEYSILLLPALMILFGTFEMGMVIFENSVVEGATRDAARRLRTGQAQTSANPASTFQQTFCASLFSLYKCSSFTFDVRSFSDFTTIALPAPQFDAQGNVTNAQFTPGGAGTITTVRVIYRHVFSTPLIGSLMGAGTGNTLGITATAVFKTEPYS
ncbi:TadE/TadG family type IV pilus assembly protein [Paramagnetospirillum magneticum]|uniref:Flp pilus assembly protein TadG n=1 Tax=Paramagnetospirillum magneticum (strain ATCC 700264 / AMB-1) TaxID=342108 RepID=Q2W0S1_PARM1|nr:TadE/TadG family type IV pilus assembly protein [Paramagnetospirillum magneticum]BAE52554.1 Flp pilus assembly protein TadG [Paramagnetospirillum magneticum AMB-1]